MVFLLVAGFIIFSVTMSALILGESITPVAPENSNGDGIHGQLGKRLMLHRRRNEASYLGLPEGNEPWPNVPLPKRPGAEVVHVKTFAQRQRRTASVCQKSAISTVQEGPLHSHAFQ